MSFLGIRFDKHTLGNLLKNVSPAAGLIGGPAGIALAGGLSALGDKARGKDISFKNALTNATLAGGVGGLKSLVSHAVTAPTPATNIPGLPGPSSMAANAVDGAPALAGSAAPGVAASTVAPTSGNFAGNLLSAGKGLAGFAADHPTAAAGALQGLGGIATSGSENRLRNAQADLLEKQAGETQYDFEARKRRDAALAPIWSALGTSFTPTSGYAGIAANPYAPKVGA